MNRLKDPRVNNKRPSKRSMKAKQMANKRWKKHSEEAVVALRNENEETVSETVSETVNESVMEFVAEQVSVPEPSTCSASEREIKLGDFSYSCNARHSSHRFLYSAYQCVGATLHRYEMCILQQRKLANKIN